MNNNFTFATTKRRINYRCRGVSRDGIVCEKSHCCARAKAVPVDGGDSFAMDIVDLLCYSGFSFFIPTKDLK